MLEIKEIDLSYLDQVLAIAYETYLRECTYVPQLKIMGKECLLPYLRETLQNKKGLVYVDDNKVLGFLVYDSCYEEANSINYLFPYWGYGAIGAKRENILSRLFEEFAKKIFHQKKLHLEIKLYAHDSEILQLFSFLQFGIQCEEGVHFTSEPIPSTSLSMIHELSKEELQTRWTEIWGVLQQLFLHLQQSPVFYPGKEFTEELYQEYLMMEETRVFVAEIDGAIIGIIDANEDGNGFITNFNDFYNVGDIFVENAYRGQQIAQNLLAYVNQSLMEKGIHVLWVEHGTANPTARGFWNKYFSTYSYTMIRDIYPF